jgi:osmotically-inducible protein OsmY
MNRPTRRAHPTPDDEALRLAVEGSLAPLSLETLTVRVADGVVHLTGQVSGSPTSREAEARARRVPGVTKVVNEIQVAVEGYGANETQSVGDVEAGDAASSEPREREGPEPDFTDSIGAESVAESVSEAEPYFPPTDTVVKPRPRTEEGVEWVGGFAPTAMDDAANTLGHPANWQLEDSEIAEDVRLALEEDAATTDLKIHVHVRRGIVFLRGTVSTIDDAEAAESAASRVPGVIEVREELQLE